jgi:hypothetical protein
MAKQVISNKVYESLQVPTEQSRNTVGKILYANSFSGVAQVPMPADLKALIDSDLGLIGNNILVQLEQKMKGYPNGPWYIDSRDGVIYIHNRKFTQEPEYNYIYQSENGEVLRVAFTMQNVTKRVKATLSQTIDPDEKDIIVGSTGIQEPDKGKEQLTSKRDKTATPQDNTEVVPSWDYNTGQNFGLGHPNTQAEFMDNQMRANGSAVPDLKAIREVDSKEPLPTQGQSFNAGKEAKLNQMSVEEYQMAIFEIEKTLPSDKRAILQQIKKTCKTGKSIESNLKQYFEAEKYIFTDEEQVKYLAEEYIDPTEYDPEGYRVKSGRAMGGLEHQIWYDKAWDRGYGAMKKDPTIVEVSMADTQDYHLGYGNMGKKVKVRRWKKHDLSVPLYKLYHNLFSRYGGADKYAWAMNANANGGLKTTERKLSCQMTVVGRPSLQSSQVISLENVGKRWSGYWYIKSVQHSMDAGQGYLCTLDLIKNNARDGQITAKSNLSTQDIVSNDASSEAKTSFGKDKKKSGPDSSINFNFTNNEAMYFVEAYMDPETGKMVDPKGAGKFFLNKAYTNDLYAKEPIALAAGTVQTEGNRVYSNGVLKPGKVTVKWVDPSKITPEMKAKYNFDWTNYAEKMYLQYNKNKKNK